MTERGEPATLVLFVTNATEPAVHAELGELMSCPEMVTGIPLAGDYHVGLVRGGALVSQVSIPRVNEGTDEPSRSAIALPLRNTRQWNAVFWGGEPTESHEVEPTKLMRLADFDGDGHAWEFRLVQPGVCGHVMTLLAGYSARRREAIVYPIIEHGRRIWWQDNLFPSPMNPLAREVRWRIPCGDHGMEVDWRRRYEYRADQEAWVLIGERRKDCGFGSR